MGEYVWLVLFVCIKDVFYTKTRDMRLDLSRQSTVFAFKIKIKMILAVVNTLAR